MDTIYRKANGKDCIHKNGHQFQIIHDTDERTRIRKTFPKMTAPLWRCQCCKKITEST